MNHDIAAVEQRVARVVRKLEANKPVAKRDRGLEQLFEQAARAEPGTVDTAFATDARFTLKPDARSRGARQTDRA